MRHLGNSVMYIRYLGFELLGGLGEPDIELFLQSTLHVKFLEAARLVPSGGLYTLGLQCIT